MAGSISRGWTLTKQSWAVLRSDRSLVTFPMLSAVFAILAAVAIWTPTVLATGALRADTVNQNDPVYYIAGAATVYLTTFFAIFFNVALAACAVRSLRGEDTTVGEGISAAMNRIGPIVGWSLVAATVGLILRAVADRAPALGKIAVWIAGAAWAIATFFVVPVIALEGAGPVRSLKRSVAVVKERWGEGATGTVAISAVTMVVGMVVVLLGAAAAFVLSGVGQTALAIVVGALAVAVVIVIGIISSALTEIFRVAVYQCAVTGETSAGFDGRLLQTAFDGHRRRL